MDNIDLRPCYDTHDNIHKVHIVNISDDSSKAICGYRTKLWFQECDWETLFKTIDDYIQTQKDLICQRCMRKYKLYNI